MANELAASLAGSDLGPKAKGHATGGFSDPYGSVSVGDCRGVALNPQGTFEVSTVVRIPEAVALATGLTVSVLLADDPNAGDAGNNVRLGVTIGPITSGTSTLDDAGALAGSTESLATITMPSTSGVAKVQSFAIANASLNSLAAGSWAMVKVRRYGTNTLDTHSGRVVILGVNVRNT